MKTSIIEWTATDQRQTYATAATDTYTMLSRPNQKVDIDLVSPSELPPTLPEELSPPEAPRKPSGARVAHTLKRSMTFADIEDEGEQPEEISSDHGVAQDEYEDGAQKFMDEDEDNWVDAPDFVEYMEGFPLVPQSDMMALLRAAIRYLEDRMELDRVRKGLPTKNSTRRGMTYKKSKQ